MDLSVLLGNALEEMRWKAPKQRTGKDMAGFVIRKAMVRYESSQQIIRRILWHEGIRLPNFADVKVNFL